MRQRAQELRRGRLRVGLAHGKAAGQKTAEHARWRVAAGGAGSPVGEGSAAAQADSSVTARRRRAANLLHPHNLRHAFVRVMRI